MGGVVNSFPASLSSSCWLVNVLHIISCLPTETFYYYSAEFMSSTAASCQYKRGNQQNQANHSLLNYMHRNFYIFNTAPFLIYPTTRVSHHLQNVYICSHTDHQSIVILFLYQLAYHSCMVNPQRSFTFVKTIYLYTWRSIHFYNIDVIICILCSLMKSGVTQVIFIVYNNLHSADKHFSWTKSTIMMMLHSYMQTGSACTSAPCTACQA